MNNQNVAHLRSTRGDLIVNWSSLMEMAGFPPPGGMTNEGYITSNGLVFKLTNGEVNTGVLPVYAREMRKEVGKLITAANRWLRKTAPGFKRNVKLTPYQVVELHQYGKDSHFSIIRVKVGDTINIPRYHGSHFGSGGGRGIWEEYGSVSKIWDKAKVWRTAFVSGGEYTVTFDKGPAMVFTSATDAINGKRVFDFTLYIAE